MTDQITISGEVFTVPIRYEEGHEINAKEAEVLNQAYHNALRNNWLPKISKAKEIGSFNKTIMQTRIAEYAVDYQFGGKRPKKEADPALPAAMNSAKEVIRAELKRKGINLRNVTGEMITKFAGRYLLNHPELLQQARERLKGTEDLSALVNEMPVKG